MNRGLRRVAMLALLAGFVAWPASGQIFRYMAFGDSITLGAPPFDPQGIGYPGRLDNLLGCTLPDCEVVNEGLGGEKTFQGVTRIETLLDDEPWDIVLLMEGINDVHLEFSNNSIEANLIVMDEKARDHGVDTVHASNIHLDPDSDSGQIPAKRQQIANLRTRIMNLAAARNRYFADPWTPLCPTTQCFNQHYYQPGGGEINTVGHPDPSGFAILAGTFEDIIESTPVPGPVTAVSPTGTIATSVPVFTWTKESPADATWYEFRLLNSNQVELRRDWHEENAICTGNTCTLNEGAFADGSYTWEVRGRNPRGRSGWVSTPFTILTLLPPTAVDPTAPIFITGDTSPLFEWSRESPTTASAYRLEVSDTGAVIHDVTYEVALVCGFQLECEVDPFDGAPLVPGDYSWRMQGENAAGPGPWIDPVEFEVEPDLLFFDGFESGDTSAWSATVP